MWVLLLNSARDDNCKLRYFALLMVVLIPLCWLGISNHGFWGTDEPRVAEIGREMALSGNWAVPMLNRKPFLEQPPLYYGTLAVTFRLFGVSDRVARIPSALFSMGGAVALFFLASMFFGPRAGFLSAFVLVTTFEYFQIGHWVLVDSALTCFVICAMAFFAAAYTSQEKRKKLLFYVLLYLSCTLAFYAKGFVGVVIPALAVVVFLLFERNLREVLQMRLWLGIILFSALVLPWFLALWHQGGAEHLKTVLVENHLNRFMRPGNLGHAQPLYFYLADFPPGFLPWIILIVPLLYRAFSGTGKLPAQARTGLLLAKCWFFSGFVFLSMASGKRLLYTLPVFAPLAMMTAWFVETSMRPVHIKKIEKVFLWMFAVFPLAVGAAAGPLYFHFTEGDLPGGPRALPPVIWVLSAVAVAPSLVAFWFLFRGNLRRFWVTYGATLFVLLVLVLTALVPIVDSSRSVAPFCKEVRSAIGKDAPVYSFIPDESLRGAIPFYTGRYIDELWDIEQVKEVLKGPEQLFFVERDSGGALERMLLSAGKLRVMLRHGMGSERSLVLLTNR